MPDQEVAIRSREEIEGAIQSFTDDDWARLKIVAKRYAFGRPIEPDDLLQEALTRSLISRNCPVHVDVVKFLAEAMRGIAHDESVKAKAKSRPPMAMIMDSHKREQVLLTQADQSVNIEETVIDEESAANIRRSILAQFEGDPQARDILEGRMEGLTAAEMRELTGLDEKAYDSKTKLIWRRIRKVYPEGWKP